MEPMTLTDLLPARPTSGTADIDPDALLDAFTTWAAERGISLYPAQEEAVIEILTGANVILATPTGSGKSLVAIGAHFAALAEGRRTYYTAPIKALVSEKFFALCDVFGADKVGMLTGDASVNPQAPIICCTAEVLANQALREGDKADIGQVVMDEFHFYSEPDRGWAWQVPLLELPQAQFLLMSATLGDVTRFQEDLTRRTGRDTAVVTNTERPVPLSYSWALTPLHETLEELLTTNQAPVYVVHFTQAAALERAQALTSINVCTREEKDKIAELIGDFRFSKGFGKTLSRLVRHGIGVHHAGMLPKYRRLVEQLAQAGLLKVICGTDTLGVGINVPIRTVVLTGLTKYDGRRQRVLKAREFHQIAGRAGRAGYDTSGAVVVQAPDHVIENHKALQKAGDDPKKQRKVQRKKPPEGFVTWTEDTFERLVAAEPEALVSRMRVSHGMLLNVIAREGNPFEAMRRLLRDNHEDPRSQVRLVRRAIALYRTLLAAGVVERLDAPDPDGRGMRLVDDLQLGFALNQPLSTYALATLETLDPESPTYALDVVSVIEATLEDPRPVLNAQEYKARGEAVAEMKADGIEYDERMDLLEEVSWPKPLQELLEHTYEVYRTHAPVDRGEPGLAEVGGARHVRAGDDVRGVRRLLRPRALRGRRAPLPRRHLQGAAADRARRHEGRRAHRPDRVARRGRAADRLEPARRVGAADPPRRPGAVGGRAASRFARRGRSAPTSAPSASSCATRSSGGSSSPRARGTTSWGSSTGSPGWTPRPGARRSRPTSRSTTRSTPAPTREGRTCSWWRRPAGSGRCSRSSVTPTGTTTGGSSRRSTSTPRTRRASS